MERERERERGQTIACKNGITENVATWLINAADNADGNGNRGVNRPRACREFRRKSDFRRVENASIFPRYISITHLYERARRDGDTIHLNE